MMCIYSHYTYPGRTKSMGKGKVGYMYVLQLGQWIFVRDLVIAIVGVSGLGTKTL